MSARYEQSARHEQPEPQERADPPIGHGNEDEGYDEGSGDRITPDTPIGDEDDRWRPEPGEQPHSRHLPADIPPDAPEE